MKHLTILILLFFSSLSVNAYEIKDFLQKEADISEVKSSLILNQKWVPYPSYTDRSGWNALTGNNKDEIIRRGNAFLNYKWEVITATDYLAYDRTGIREVMEDPFGRNISALTQLVLAELAEGKGRFVDQIANGVWFYCEMTSWALAAHVGREQIEKTSLPSYKEQVIELTSADVGSFLAWTYYFFKNQLDEVNPLIAERLRKNLQIRILDPYMNRSNFWWQAFDATPQTMVNNWNPWCNCNVLTCFLLLENDPEKLAEAVHRTMVSVDKFINRSNADGACEEGPSYWGHASGKLYDYLQILSLATNGKVSIFDQPMIKNMGEYIAKSYIGNGWVVNFADASAKGGGLPGVIFRYGKAVKSSEMQQFASYLFQQNAQKSYYYSGRDLFRSLENLGSYQELIEIKPALPQVPSIWYPQTEFCYMRNHSGFFFAAKGGYNDESHNHNDVGSFILYLDQSPILIDAGVGTYTKQTFSNDRYSIWTMQSDYHNLPIINGTSQSYGPQFRSSDIAFDSGKSRFSLNLTKAYPQNAAAKKWIRTYQLKKDGLVMEDVFELTETKAPNELHFLTAGKPQTTAPGIIMLEGNGIKLKMKYDKDQFEPTVETIPLNDRSLSKVWGGQIYRLKLTAKKQQLIGKYLITITK